jgi:hypothetical protein
MVFGELFERFAESSPAAVMHRATMERVFAPETLGAIFHQAAEAQYERELPTLSSSMSIPAVTPVSLERLTYLSHDT